MSKILNSASLRRTRHILRCACESLESRRLLAAPQVYGPPALDPESFASLPYGYFEMEESHPEGSGKAQQLVLPLDQAVTFAGEPLSVTNLTTSATITQFQRTITGDTATYQFMSEGDYGEINALPRGNYEGIFNADLITNAAGQKLDGNGDGVAGDDFATSWFFQPGDANHDRTVNADDYANIDFFSTNPSNLPNGENGFPRGDFNYDGSINADDYAIIDLTSGTVLPPPPDQPNELTAAAGRGYVDLNWVPPTDPSLIDGYYLYRSIDGGLAFPLYQTVWGGNITSWTDANLPDGTKFDYRMRAFTIEDGASMTSNRVWTVTNLPGPGEATASLIARNGVTLSWMDNTSNESGFEIEQTAPGGAVTTLSLPPQSGSGAMSYRVTGLAASSGYSFRVRAVTAAQASAWSPDVTVTTLAEGAPTAPTDVTATGLADGRSMQLTWSDNSDNETGFTIERKTETGLWQQAGTTAADATSFTDQGLYSLTAYEYRLAAQGSGGDSTSSETTIVVTQYGDGIVYSGRPGGTDQQMFDGVSASWSGPYDRTAPPLRNDTLILELDNLPDHDLIEITFSGGGVNATENDGDTVTLTLASASDQYVMSVAEAHLFGLQLVTAHEDESATINLTGSGFEDDTAWWGSDSWGIELMQVSLQRERIGATNVQIDTPPGAVGAATTGKGTSDVAHTDPKASGSNGANALRYRIVRSTGAGPAPANALRISKQTVATQGGITNVEFTYTGVKPPATGYRYAVTLEAETDSQLVCSLIVEVK